MISPVQLNQPAVLIFSETKETYKLFRIQQGCNLLKTLHFGGKSATLQRIWA